jgi:hypothetical protein
MAIRSVHDRRYSRRFLLMGAAIIGFSLWSLYDGFIRYPHRQERAVAFEKLFEEGRDKEWDQYARDRGWSTDVPDEPKSQEEFDASIVMQFVMAAVTALIGVPMFVTAWRSRSQWVESSGTGLTSSWGESFNFDQVQLVDKKRWRNKGIAKVTYQDGDRRRRFVIDDYKFERPTMDQILYELEQRIDPEMIVNGPPEPPPGERADATDAVPLETSGQQRDEAV